MAFQTMIRGRDARGTINLVNLVNLVNPVNPVNPVQKGFGVNDPQMARTYREGGRLRSNNFRV